jgi:hypothetical protein
MLIVVINLGVSITCVQNRMAADKLKMNKVTFAKIKAVVNPGEEYKDFIRKSTEPDKNFINN